MAQFKVRAARLGDCAVCHHANPADAHFCCACGAALHLAGAPPALRDEVASAAAPATADAGRPSWIGEPPRLTRAALPTGAAMKPALSVVAPGGEDPDARYRRIFGPRPAAMPPAPPPEDPGALAAALTPAHEPMPADRWSAFAAVPDGDALRVQAGDAPYEHPPRARASAGLPRRIAVVAAALALLAGAAFLVVREMSVVVLPPLPGRAATPAAPVVPVVATGAAAPAPVTPASETCAPQLAALSLCGQAPDGASRKP